MMSPTVVLAHGITLFLTICGALTVPPRLYAGCKDSACGSDHGGLTNVNV